MRNKVEEAKKYFKEKVDKLTKEPKLNNPSKKEMQKRAAAKLAEEIIMDLTCVDGDSK